MSERDFAALARRAAPAGGGAPARAARAGGRLPRRDYGGAELAIEVDLAPRPKERARTYVDEGALVRAFVGARGDARRFMAAVKGGGVMRTVTPEATRAFESAVALASARALAESGLEPLRGPVELSVVFRLLGDPETWPTGPGDGDLDNLEKAILDGIKPVWLDDNLVVGKTGWKVCAPAPGISLRLRHAPPGAPRLPLAWPGPA